MDFTPGMSFSLCTGKLDQGEHIIDDIILSGNRYHEEAILCPYTGPRVVFWYLNSTQHSHAATHSTHVYSLQRLDRRSCYCEEGRKKTLVHCPAAHSSCIFLGKSLTVVTDMDWQSWFCQFLGVQIPALGPFWKEHPAMALHLRTQQLPYTYNSMHVTTYQHLV